MFLFDSRKLACFCPIWMEDTKSVHNCGNINDNYVKPWKHNEINLKGKMPLASFEELESEDIAISIDGDRISDLVREGNFMYTLLIFSIFILKLKNSMFLFMCRRCICHGCTHREQ